ncbi:MAG: CopD family protein [Pseudohongiella sp.]|nr:CopD family protein [Pseudohongiella sp.]
MLTLLSKFLIYVSVVGVIGGSFAYVLLERHHDCLRSIRSYIRLSSAVGMLGTVSNFLIQVGAFSASGWSGMFDVSIISILMETSIGDSALTRLIGFGVLMVSTLKLIGPLTRLETAVRGFCVLTGVTALLFSFTQTGHLADADILARIVVALHVLMAAIWLGSLYPLWYVNSHGNPLEVQQSMKLFGGLAMAIVAILLLGGFFLAYRLVGSVTTLVADPYGWGLLFKVATVFALLLIAAGNKWLLTPNLLKKGMARRLSGAIRLETALALMILFATGIITTLIGI